MGDGALWQCPKMTGFGENNALMVHVTWATIQGSIVARWAQSSERDFNHWTPELQNSNLPWSQISHYLYHKNSSKKFKTDREVLILPGEFRLKTSNLT
jgi:hypothetical protein